MRTRLTFQNGAEVTPVWSPDGTRIAYSSMAVAVGKNTLLTMSADGGDQQVLLEIQGGQAWITDWSRDGRFLLFSRGDYVGGRSDVWLLPLDGGSPQMLVSAANYNDRAAFSPDGRWIAYRSNESGQAHIYASAFNAPGADGAPASLRGKWQVSSVAGATVDWRADGREIYYLTLEGDWMRAEVNGDGNQLHVGAVTKMFDCDPWYLGRIVCNASRDGQTFAVTTHLARDDQPVTLVLDWLTARDH